MSGAVQVMDREEFREAVRQLILESNRDPFDATLDLVHVAAEFGLSFYGGKCPCGCDD